MQHVASLVGASLQQPAVLRLHLPSAFLPCSEGRKPSPLHAADDASPCATVCRRARTAGWFLTHPSSDHPLPSVGHLHTSMRRTQEHGISVISACTKLHIILISATDRPRQGRADPIDRSSQQPQQQWRDPLQWSREHSLRAPCWCGQQSTSVLRAIRRRRKAQWQRTRFRRFNPTKRARCISTTN
jgi:hypothetical protein